MEGWNGYAFEYRDVPAEEELDRASPSDVPHWASLTFSTGESWNKVATVYNGLVEEKIGQDRFRPLCTEIEKGDTPFSTAVAVTEWLNGKIRYTGLELGENSIVPTLPEETLRRGFGDCKDKTVIVTGILREMGFEASVALLRAGTIGGYRPLSPRTWRVQPRYSPR